MSKSFKFKNNMHLDSTGIVHNKELLSDILNEKIFNMIGTKGTNGYCKLPSGLVLCWGSEDSLTFEKTANNGGYTKIITLPYTYTQFVLPIVCSQYPLGFSTSMVCQYSLSSLSLGCAVSLRNYRVNWLTIGF